MTPRQQTILFCKQHGIAISPVGKDKVVMLGKKHPNGALWSECFDNWKDAYTFLRSAQNRKMDKSIDQPWHTPNYK